MFLQRIVVMLYLATVIATVFLIEEFTEKFTDVRSPLQSTASFKNLHYPDRDLTRP